MRTPVAASPSSLTLSRAGMRIDQRHTTTGDNTFFNGGAGGAQSVLDAVLLFLQFGLGCRTDADDGNATGQLGKTFLQLLAVVIAGAVLDLRRESASMRPLMALCSPSAVDNGGVVLGADDLGGATEVARA